jgi:hypothetical protein
VSKLGTQRRKCKLANSDYADTDLRQFEKVILDTINKTVPGKNPKVYKTHFSTDVLNQSEAVSLGRALARIDDLKAMGKAITIFRLFEGRVCNNEENKKKTHHKPKGGRMK